MTSSSMLSPPTATEPLRTPRGSPIFNGSADRPPKKIPLVEIVGFGTNHRSHGTPCWPAFFEELRRKDQLRFLMVKDHDGSHDASSDF